MMTKIEKAGFASPAGSFSEKPESAKRPLSREGGYRHGRDGTFKVNVNTVCSANKPGHPPRLNE